jgi:hypothetical protein
MRVHQAPLQSRVCPPEEASEYHFVSADSQGAVLLEILVVLSIDFRWTPEKIADWLESLGY